MMKDQKGITLIALIITIIVMIILVAVTVIVALDSGLFTTAKGAGKNYQAAASAENSLGSGYVNIDGRNVSITEYAYSTATR